MICGSGGSKSRLAKAAGAEPAGQKTPKSQCPVAPGAGVQGERILGSRVADAGREERVRSKPRQWNPCIHLPSDADSLPWNLAERCPPQLLGERFGPVPSVPVTLQLHPLQ